MKSLMESNVGTQRKRFELWYLGQEIRFVGFCSSCVGALLIAAHDGSDGIYRVTDVDGRVWDALDVEGDACSTSN